MKGRFIFRVWDEDDKKFIKDFFSIGNGGKVHFINIEEWEIIRTSEDDVIEQYIGLTDKNDKHIYENDIIDLYGKIYRIVWDNDFACFSIKSKNSMHTISDISQSIVIGNIHENPELLEELNLTLV